MGDNILFVDDEMPVLKALKRTFLRKDFTIFIAASGQEALDILAHQEIDIVISDMRMPEMDGHQLLRKVKELYPATTRLILSGYADEKEISKTILDGSSKMYILKPWDSQLLSKTIQQLLDVRELLRNRNLLEIINKIDGLSALPRIYNKLIDLINQDVDVAQIARLIEEDPAITSQILHIANSAFYGIRTGSISQAVIYLGLTAVKNIVLSTNLCQSRGGQGIHEIDKDLLWRHASRTNQLVGQLYRKLIGKRIPTTASTVGLLHNIGKMALLVQFPAKYAQIDARLKTRKSVSVDELEREFIGVSHQDVGGYLLEWWGLPHEIVESAMFHHDPFNETVNDRQLVSIVHIASYYAAREIYQDINEPFLDERTFSLLQTTQEDCERFIREE